MIVELAGDNLIGGSHHSIAKLFRQLPLLKVRFGFGFGSGFGFGLGVRIAIAVNVRSGSCFNFPSISDFDLSVVMTRFVLLKSIVKFILMMKKFYYSFVTCML